MVKIMLTGACGRMGRAILKLLPDFKDVSLACAVEAPGNLMIGKLIYGDVELGKDPGDRIKDCDVVVDFTGAEASIGVARTAAAAKKPLVIGSTGHDADQRAHILSLSREIPIVYSPNMSVGVNTMFKLIDDAARAMGGDYKIEIVETHHIHKKDSPSGTARKMMDILKSAGLKCEVRSIREGEVIGDHTVTFAGPYETLSITHHAVSREVFAAGALKAALWVAGKRPGLYDMKDVLNIRY